MEMREGEVDQKDEGVKAMFQPTYLVSRASLMFLYFCKLVRSNFA